MTKIYQSPETLWRPSRRRLLQTLGGSLMALGSLKTEGLAGVKEENGEPYWEAVKEHFPLRPDLILMNAANLCPPPYSVLETVDRLSRDMDADASFQNRDKFSQLREAARQAVARLLGAKGDEIALVRNTSEGNNAVVNGLDLKPGEEVLLWDQNHPTNSVAWDVRSKRIGFTVKRLGTPRWPGSPEDLIKPFLEAITRRTRVLAFSHVSNISGFALPAGDLCRLARERDILTLVDGAQTCGAFGVDLHEMGCDFYTASAHKWLLGPKEVGVLYVRGEQAGRLWPSVVGAGWEEASRQGARKFEALGQRNDPTVAAVTQAVEFEEHIGISRIQARVLELASLLKREIQKIPGAKLHTPLLPELSSGVVVFELDNVDARKGFEKLYRDYGIAGAAMSGLFNGLRLCPHVYNVAAEVDRVAAALRRL